MNKCTMAICLKRSILFLLFVGSNLTNLKAQHKILFVTSNQDFYGNTKITASNHFEEIVVPYHIFTKAGFEVDFISPKGGAVPVGYINASDTIQKRYLYDGIFMDKLEHTMSAGDAIAGDYAAIYFSGGGAAMYGVPEDTTIQKLTEQIHKKNGIVSAICHGTAGLIYVKDSKGNALVKGKKVCGYPDKLENKDMEYYKALPFVMDDAIRSNGGNFVFSEKGKDGFFIVDGRLVTGQDPASVTNVANEVLKLLKANFKQTNYAGAKSEVDQIRETLLDYIEGTANGQPERLRKAFHPKFNLYTIANDTLWIRSGEQYISNIKSGEKSNRLGRIISIDVEKNAASAKVEITIPNWRIFTDYFLLLKYGNSWKIVQKSYTFRELADKKVYNAETDKAKKTDDILSDYNRYDLFNGAAIVAKNGKVILKKGYGKASFSWNINNAATTKFRIGSLTKQFTALLILQLKQEGKLKLEDKIADHLPGFFKNTGNKITIHHLLSMTSGLPNYTDGTTPIMEREELSPKQFAEKYFKDKLLFEPGKSISYCNTGYYILGMIIESVTKKSYETVLKERVFDVLGMKNSGVEMPEEVVPDLSEGHYFYLGEYIAAHSLNIKTYCFAAGAIYSTVEDLFLWDQSFYTDKLLDAGNKKLMCTKYLPNYGYGLAVNSRKNYLGTSKDITLISHDGGVTGWSSYMIRIPEDSIFVVLLDNTRAGMRGNDLEGISNNIMPVLYGLKAEPPKPQVSIELMRTIKLKGVTAGIAHYKTDILSDSTAYNFRGLESSLNAIGRNYLSTGDVVSAIEIFKLSVEQFPNSANAHDDLGEAYYINNQPALSLQHYKKSLELDPKSENAKKMIRQINKSGKKR